MRVCELSACGDTPILVCDILASAGVCVHTWVLCVCVHGGALCVCACHSHNHTGQVPQETINMHSRGGSRKQDGGCLSSGVRWHT